jgi:hypothetical protein
LFVGDTGVFATAIWAPVSLQSWKKADDTIVPRHLVVLKSQNRKWASVKLQDGQN